MVWALWLTEWPGHPPPRSLTLLPILLPGLVHLLPVLIAWCRTVARSGLSA